ncbi:hypothetical protein RND81_06G224900 [Saponaria officinalis]|uniref:Uncharacterized protein n=1 Tax=Saponaria officinalis TaxID=3572 RepID=A0AAW1KFN2_SAPOF
MAFSRTTIVLLLFVVLMGSALARGPFLGPSSALAPLSLPPTDAVTDLVAAPTSATAFPFVGEGADPLLAPIAGGSS